MVINRKQSEFSRTIATIRPTAEGSPKGKGKQSGEIPNSLELSIGTRAIARASRKESKMDNLMQTREDLVSNFVEHFTAHPRSSAATVRRKTEASDAKMDINPVTWQPTPLSHHAPYSAKLPKVNMSTLPSTPLDRPISMFTIASSPIKSLMAETYSRHLKIEAITSELQMMASNTMVQTPILVSQLPNRKSQGLKGPRKQNKNHITDTKLKTLAEQYPQLLVSLT